MEMVLIPREEWAVLARSTHKRYVCTFLVVDTSTFMVSTERMEGQDHSYLGGAITLRHPRDCDMIGRCIQSIAYHAELNGWTSKLLRAAVVSHADDADGLAVALCNISGIDMGRNILPVLLSFLASCALAFAGDVGHIHARREEVRLFVFGKCSSQICHRSASRYVTLCTLLLEHCVGDGAPLQQLESAFWFEKSSAGQRGN